MRYQRIKTRSSTSVSTLQRHSARERTAPQSHGNFQSSTASQDTKWRSQRSAPTKSSTGSAWRWNCFLGPESQRYSKSSLMTAGDMGLHVEPSRLSFTPQVAVLPLTRCQSTVHAVRTVPPLIRCQSTIHAVRWAPVLA